MSNMMAKTSYILEQKEYQIENGKWLPEWILNGIYWHRTENQPDILSAFSRT
jgi:adenylate kinase family enzyme